MTENTDNKQTNTSKPWQFQKGQSGNPNGRPKGSRNKASMIAKQLIEDETEEIIKKLVELAKSGEMQAIKLVVERLLPPVKELPLQHKTSLPELNNLEDIIDAYSKIINLVESSELTVGEAKEIAGIFESKRKSIESVELQEKIDELKNIINSNRS